MYAFENVQTHSHTLTHSHVHYVFKVNVDTYDIKFELHRPFKPVEQLLAVLPADSVGALPGGCRWLMTDQSSPIIDLYDSDIPIDPNGKHLPHLWVLLLPFLEEKKINDAYLQCVDKMTEIDELRNAEGHPLVLVHNSSPLVALANQELLRDTGGDLDAIVEFDHTQGDGFAGILSYPAENFRCRLGGLVKGPARPLGAWSDIQSNQVHCFNFKLPEEKFHVSCLLVG